jgi:CRP-like cAMP-binding protein
MAIAAARNDRGAVISRLSSLVGLSAAELRVLEELPGPPRMYPARSELVGVGMVQAPQLLLSGWACYHRLLGDGRRQIVSFLLPGDPVGSLLNAGLPSNCAAIALTPVSTIDARPLVAAAEPSEGLPGLSHLLRVMASREEMALRDQIVRLGRQTAYERMVHLFLEFRDRLHSAGLAAGHSFTLPLTQETLADALGLSVVHVNRTLQQIRRDGLLELRGGTVTLLQPEGLEAAADWRPPPR